MIILNKGGGNPGLGHGPCIPALHEETAGVFKDPGMDQFNISDTGGCDLHGSTWLFGITH